MICPVLPQGRLELGKMEEFTIGIDFMLTFGLLFVQMKGCCHRFSMAEFQPPNPEIC